MYFENTGQLPTKVYTLHQLPPEYVVDGPSIIIDQLSTILIEPNCTAKITESKDIGNFEPFIKDSINFAHFNINLSSLFPLIEITIDESSGFNVTEELDAIQLSIFSHRFMSIAEQMGR